MNGCISPQEREALKQEIFSSLHCALPGTVVFYNAERQTAEVQPAVKTGSMAYPVLPDVPVFMPMPFEVRPGDACRFLPVTADEAEQARLEQKLQPVPVSPPRRFHICINGHAYDVTAQEITC